jgi:hypothetical protein
VLLLYDLEVDHSLLDTLLRESVDEHRQDRKREYTALENRRILHLEQKDLSPLSFHVVFQLRGLRTDSMDLQLYSSTEMMINL